MPSFGILDQIGLERDIVSFVRRWPEERQRLQKGRSEIDAEVPERSLHVSAALPPDGVAHAIDPAKLKQAGEHRDQQDRHARRHQPIYSDTSDPIEHRSHYSFQIWSPASTGTQTLPRLY